MFLIFTFFFFERTLYKSNYIIFILSWYGTHTEIRSKLVDIVTAGSQKITLWGPQRTPLGIFRVKWSRTLAVEINIGTQFKSFVLRFLYWLMCLAWLANNLMEYITLCLDSSTSLVLSTHNVMYSIKFHQIPFKPQPFVKEYIFVFV